MGRLNEVEIINFQYKIFQQKNFFCKLIKMGFEYFKNFQEKTKKKKTDLEKFLNIFKF